MLREWFDEQMARLSGLRFVPADTETHWEALRDLPESTLEAAVAHAQQSCDVFPSPATLRKLSRGPIKSGCWYRHDPPCVTSSECRERFFREARDARNAEAS